MKYLNRKYFIIAAVLGASAVGLGAFGAHGLKNFLMGEPDALKRMEWWQKASYYHLTHGLLAVFFAQYAKEKFARVGFVFCLLGILFFSGSLYTMTLTNIRALGAVTPIGGVFFILAWASLWGVGQDVAKE